MSESGAPLLHELAALAGVMIDWQNAYGQWQRVADDVVMALLRALGLPADSDSSCQDSILRLRAERFTTGLPSFVTGVVEEAIRIPAGSTVAGLVAAGSSVRITLEHGQTIDAVARCDESGALVLPAIRTYGYHTLEWNSHRVTLAIAPKRCFGIADALPASNAAPRLWGLTTQIYSLRRAQPTGLGDFTALTELATWAARRGASALGINPVHANFGSDPRRYSPYSPSSRLFLNPVYVDPAATFGSAAMADAIAATVGMERWEAFDQEPLIDWEQVAPARLAVLAALFARQDAVLNSEKMAELRSFCKAGGVALLDHARFEVLDTHYRQGSGIWWTSWPTALRDPRSEAVSAFAAAHQRDVDFQIFLQWLAHRGLLAAQQSARSNGMPVGLVYDLAVGTDPTGSHAWSRQGEIVEGLVCGAPPDLYNPLGQSWGLTAFGPDALRRTGYRAFIEMLRAGLRQSGGLRIDHVLGMMRLWLIPEDRPASQGAYLRYPFEDLLRLVALESWRHRAIIIGENLGTVPAGFNERLAESGILGTSVLWFEEEMEHAWGSPSRLRFRAPEHWPRESVATTTTHDLPSSKGWWRGMDLEWRERLNLFAEGDSLGAQQAHRDVERVALWEAMEQRALVQGGPPGPDEAPVQAMMEFVAQTPAPLALFPVEDLFGEVEQPNLPGTVSGHPNWRRRLPQTIAAHTTEPGVEERTRALNRQRGTAAAPK